MFHRILIASVTIWIASFAGFSHLEAAEEKEHFSRESWVESVPIGKERFEKEDEAGNREAPSSEPTAESGAFFGLGNGWEFGFGRFQGYSFFTVFNALNPDTPAGSIVADTDWYTAYPCVPDISKNSGLKGGYLGALQIGFDHRFRDMRGVMGMVLEGGLATAFAQPYIFNVITADGVNLITTTIYGKLRHQGFLSVACRGGIALGRSMCFVKVGYSGDFWRLSGFPYRARKKWNSNVLLGCGVDINMSRSLAFGLSMDVRFGSKVKFALNNIYYDSTLEVRPFLSNAMFWIKHKIPVCR